MRIIVTVDSFEVVGRLRREIGRCAFPELSKDMTLVAGELLNDVCRYNHGRSRRVEIMAREDELVVKGECFRRNFATIAGHLQDAAPVVAEEIGSRPLFNTLHQGMWLVQALGDVCLCPVGIIRVTFPKATALARAVA